MKHFCLAGVIILSISLCSCNSIREITGQDKLTESERERVVTRARKFIILVNHLNISPEDKRFVKDNLPKMSIQYTGAKSGIAKMRWRINPSYSIKITCDGDLLDKSCPIRMTISRFAP